MTFKSLLLSTALSLFLISFLFAQTTGELTVTVSTSSAGGNYSPKNIVAIWIEDDSGDFVKTLLAYAQNRKTHLNTWQASTTSAGSPYNTVDAITGATKSSHGTRTCYWDGTDITGALVADGSYKIRMELTDKNSTGNFTSFSFSKGEEPEAILPSNVPSFSSISINWVPESTNLSDLKYNGMFKVYPNPTMGNIVIEGMSFIELVVNNSKGELIYKGDSKLFSLTPYPTGVYYFTLSTDKTSETHRVVKK